MKVKNGMASSSSFDMILPNSRNGMVLRKLASRRPVRNAESGKGDADRGERKGDRIADQQKDDEPQEHVGRDVDRLHSYCTGFS